MAERTCSVEGCERRHEARGWCNAHYKRWRQSGDVGPAGALPRQPLPIRTCAVEGCDREAKNSVAELCKGHYDRLRRTGEVGPATFWDRKRERCSVLTCTRLAKSLGMCQTHYVRARNHGDPSVVLPRGTAKGREHPRWAGASVTYSGAHLRVKRARGVAAGYPCTHCTKTAEHWAYDHEDPKELTETVSGREARYSADPAHYIPLCVPCHSRFDS